MSQKDAGKRSLQLLNHPRPPPPFPPPSCPRCSSGNTKFCYYNNYSVSQPRYLCKDCRRYWTHGGVVRNIPTGRKRGRPDSASSSSQMSKPPPSGHVAPPPPPPPPPLAWSMGSPTNPVGSFSGDSFFNQTAFKFSTTDVNTVGFGGGAPPLTTTSTPVFPHHSHGGFGIPFIQRPQFQPPPTLWTGQIAFNNISTTLTSPNNFFPVARTPTASANVVSVNQWSELNDMDSEGDPLQSYKRPSDDP